MSKKFVAPSGERTFFMFLSSNIITETVSLGGDYMLVVFVPSFFVWTRLEEIYKQ